MGEAMRRIARSSVLGCLVLAGQQAAAQEAPTPAPGSPQAAHSPATPASPTTSEASANPEPALDDVAAADLAAVQASQQRPVVLDPTAKAKTEVTLDRRTQLGLGAGFSGPLGFAGSLQILNGIGADIKDDETRVKAVCAVPMPHCAQGFLLRLDAGSGGGKFSLGLGAYANVNEDDFKGTAGVAFRVALARTWGNPIGTEPDLTYLGPELDLSILRINVTLGVLFRIDGDRGAGTLFSWGLGFGL
jgi:hypothetical protein